MTGTPKRRTQTKTIARGIYRTPTGYRVFLVLGGQPVWRRFPVTWTLPDLKAWRDEQLRGQPRRVRGVRGTLHGDADTYLRAVAAMVSIKERRRDLAYWLPRFGARSRISIRPDEVRAQLQEWKATGLAASTVNHRRTAFSHLFTVLDGRSAYNPARDVPPFRDQVRPRRTLAMALITQILDEMPASRTHARLLVLAWTGLRPSELKRLTPEDVDLELGLIYTRTVKHGPWRTVVLSSAGVAAWQTFTTRDAWGPWSLASARASLHRAVRALRRRKRHQEGLSAEAAAQAVPLLQIYDLRRSYATALRAVTDLADVQDQLGHGSARMTRIYAQQVVEKIRAAAERVASQVASFAPP